MFVHTTMHVTKYKGVAPLVVMGSKDTKGSGWSGSTRWEHRLAGLDLKWRSVLIKCCSAWLISPLHHRKSWTWGRVRPCGRVCGGARMWILHCWICGSSTALPSPVAKAQKALREHVSLYLWCSLLYRFVRCVSDLEAEEALLQLHQLTPQGVLLCQDSGDHGLGLVSGQVRLETRTSHVILTQPNTHPPQKQLQSYCNKLEHHRNRCSTRIAQPVAHDL